LYNCPDITLFEKTNKIIYLIAVNIPNVGNLQTAYTENMRKYAELSIDVKQQWQVEAAYTSPVIMSATGVIHHKPHDVLKQLYLLDLLYMTIQRSAILNTCNIESS